MGNLNIDVAKCIFNIEFTRSFTAKSEQLLKGYMKEENQLHTAFRQIIRLPLL